MPVQTKFSITSSRMPSLTTVEDGPRIGAVHPTMAAATVGAIGMAAVVKAERAVKGATKGDTAEEGTVGRQTMEVAAGTRRTTVAEATVVAEEEGG